MTPYDLTMTRTFAAPREAVWRAWTTETGLARWWWAHWPDTTYAVDARVGGAYRIETTAHGVGVRGEYREVEPYDRLAFSWIWLEDGVDGELEEVTVTFTPAGSSGSPGGETGDEAGGEAEGEAGGAKTRVDLLHTGPWTSSEARDNYRMGWDFVFDAFARVVDSAASS